MGIDTDGSVVIAGPTINTYAFWVGESHHVILQDPYTFRGEFSGFVAANTIDLAGVGFATATFSEYYVASTSLLVLTVTEGASVATIAFDNFDPSTQSLSVGTDGGTGTLITAATATTIAPAATVGVPTVSVGSYDFAKASGGAPRPRHAPDRPEGYLQFTNIWFCRKQRDELGQDRPDRNRLQFAKRNIRCRDRGANRKRWAPHGCPSIRQLRGIL